MTDYLSATERSRHMARIRVRDTAPEMHLRQLLHREGFRFRLHSRALPGRPDIVLARHHSVIFVHGCFWHRHPGCVSAYEPKSRIDFWTRKFEENVERDKRQIEALLKAGWRVAVVWECGLRRPESRKATGAATFAWLRSGRSKIEIPRKALGRSTRLPKHVGHH
jgi:DNA mismatch endonuclease (patch repair protein)